MVTLQAVIEYINTKSKLEYNEYLHRNIQYIYTISHWVLLNILQMSLN